MYKRIIPCLDIYKNMVVKGKNFKNMKVIGNIIDLAKKYYKEGADEIVFLNIEKEKIKDFSKIIKKISKSIFVPMTVGGNIKNIDDVKKMFSSGADKICLNSTLYYNSNLVSEIKFLYGSQCIVASIDVKKKKKNWIVYINGAKISIGYDIKNWIEIHEKNGVGELLVTSINRDGKKKGYDLKLYKEICKITNLPVIASGGARNVKSIKKVFEKTNVNAALAASIFHIKNVNIKDIKTKIITKNVR
ncbi:imidazole glycerol phosphate synthase subunit HisF [Candidatus Vidania fulgoroideorum]